VVTVNDPLPPASENAAASGVRFTAQSTPACSTVKVWPAIVAVSVRDPADGFGGIVTPIGVLPLPLAGVAPRPEAVHEHAALDAVNATDVVPPAAGADKLTGLIANEHVDPNCVRVYVWPPTVIVPLRCAGLLFRATEYPIVAAPLPFGGAFVMVIHDADALALHAQFAAVFNVKFPRPPRDEMLPAVGAIVYAHGGGVTTVTSTGTASMTFAAPGAFNASTPE